MLDTIVPAIRLYNGPLWHLPSLLMCYCVYYLISMIHKKKIFFIMVIVLTGYAMGIIDIFLFNEYSHHIEGVRTFLIGVVVYELYKKANERANGHVKLILLVVCIGTFICYTYYAQPINEQYIKPVIDVLFSANLVMLLSLNKAPKHKSESFTRSFSISIYIWHDIVIYYVQAFHCMGWIDKTAPYVLFYSMLFIGVISVLSSRYFEPKIRKRLDNLTANITIF